MRMNVAPIAKTHEGSPARRMTAKQELRRSVLSCLLWEKTFYESGEDIAERIARLAAACSKATVTSLAVEARSRFHLRHVPLLLLRELIRRGGPGVAEAIAATIQRPDEIGELLAIYWKDGRKPITRQMKLGIAAAFGKFDEYSLAKYDRDGPVKLRDALFLARPKTDTPERADLYRRLAERQLAAADTWEVALSGGADKREAFTRLLSEGKLGYLALLRNLRNMAEAGVDTDLVREAIISRKGAGRVLPFRYVAAARACPQFEPFIDQALCEAIQSGPRLTGKSIVLVDVSGSMDVRLSAKSDLTRMDAAAALASVVHGDLRVFTFSERFGEVPARRGMAGVDAVINSQAHSGTYLGAAVAEVNKLPHDRLIVITDEQSADCVPDPVCRRAYMINVAPYRNGVGYGRWTHIDGFSEGVLRFMDEHERGDD